MELIGSLSLKLPELSLYEFGREVAVRTGIIGGYRADGSAEAVSALENIEELLNSMAGTPTANYDAAPVEGDETPSSLSLDEWLQNVALMTDADDNEPENRNKVSLMTVHSAKGLEFRHVFIMGLEEDLFPSLREGDRYEVEEERRLFYVALTRARKRAYISLSQVRFMRGTMDFRRPSRFVEEIDAAFMDESTRKSDGTGGRRDRDGWNTRGNEGWINEKPSWEARKPEPPRKVAPVAPDTRFRKLPTVKTTPSLSDTPPREGNSRNAGFEPGTRVAHAKFGEGTVEQVETMAGASSAADLKITVTFDDPVHGRKTLLSKFARLETV
jgi:DNA helicase-2/ATP-dependent DNA helicase PcrA